MRPQKVSSWILTCVPDPREGLSTCSRGRSGFAPLATRFPTRLTTRYVVLRTCRPPLSPLRSRPLKFLVASGIWCLGRLRTSARRLTSFIIKSQYSIAGKLGWQTGVGSVTALGLVSPSLGPAEEAWFPLSMSDGTIEDIHENH
ncbi:hypothetical protein KM043_010358 [Ampulex compressa]|nr:hypothetical protein KM043_010358 [Ampulex compressa]